LSGGAAGSTWAHVLAPAQLLGYLALVLGIAAFLQKKDHRLKLLSASQCVVYAAHFYLLGNAPAAASAGVSTARSLLSMKFRSPWLVAVFLVTILWLGVHFVTSPAGLLPIVASVASTIAMFLFRGIAMRVILFCCTILWLANNLLCGSIGGTILEFTIGTINLTTIARMILDRSKVAAEEPKESDYCV
jgi:hypothetical protein